MVKAKKPPRYVIGRWQKDGSLHETPFGWDSEQTARHFGKIFKANEPDMKMIVYDRRDEVYIAI